MKKAKRAPTNALAIHSRPLTFAIAALPVTEDTGMALVVVEKGYVVMTMEVNVEVVVLLVV